MPSLPTKSPGESLPLESYKSFTVINKDLSQPTADTTNNEQMTSSNNVEAGGVKYKNVNVVKPVQRKPPNDASSGKTPTRVENRNTQVVNENARQPKKRAKKMDPLAPSQTILDPRFSRNLDLKLRKLKEKEIIAERLSRRANEKSNVSSNVRSVPPNTKKFSNSYPNVNLIRPNIVNIELKNGKENDDSMQRKFNIKNNRKKVTYSNENVHTNNKPLFITTVKKGFFLPPPPEVASLLGLEKYVDSYHLTAPSLVYSYASKPKVVAPPTQPIPKSSTLSLTLPDINANSNENNTDINMPEKALEIQNQRAGLGGAARALAALSSLAAGTAAVGSGCLHPGINKKIIRGSNMAFGGAGDAAAEARRRAVAKRRVPRSTALPDTQPYKSVQTEPYLEELFDKGEEFDVGIQTDFLPERPTTPEFIPPKRGFDRWTQIWPGDLFDFDEEVSPILELLVGKTVEQALTEVLQEEEVASMKKKAAESEEKRVAALSSAEHHQRHLIRMHKLKERHLAEAAVATEAGRCEAQKAAAATLVRTHLPAMLPSVLKTLQEQGFLISEKDSDLDETFMPWLLNEVTHEVEQMITSRDVIMDIVREVLETRAELFRIMREESLSLSSVSTEHVTSHVEPEGDDDSQMKEEMEVNGEEVEEEVEVEAPQDDENKEEENV